MSKTAIRPTRLENYPDWYQEVIKAADLAETSPVRGCMVIKPWGYALWERMQKALDEKFKATGHVNAYFPLLIPLSFMEKEAEHVEGFAKECAVVTHHRLKSNGKGGLEPDGELEEPLVIRPTSETVIGHMYAKWVQSYRDLPILMNQWANVMRWEMRTRMFLRTSEFLWQEGHTVHATAEEAQEEVQRMLSVYADFAENHMAMPVIKGKKTPDERFPGAVDTFTIEAMMQDQKALQAGTSHFLGQNFAKASGIKFLDEDGKEVHAWTTSWGVSTRLIGGLIMTHADDNGLVLPPRLAEHQVVIQPIYRDPEARANVMKHVQRIQSALSDQEAFGERIRVHVDDRDLRGGEKTWQNIKKGVPIRLEVGPRDVEADALMVARRDKDPKDKGSMTMSEFCQDAGRFLQEIQSGLFERAKAHREANSQVIASLDDFRAFFSGKSKGGFATANWSEAAIDHPMLTELKVTPRCLPLDNHAPDGKCIFSGEEGQARVVFAKAY